MKIFKTSYVYFPLNFAINIWNIIIFKQNTFSKTSLEYYLFFLSITDIISSFGVIFEDLNGVTEFLCKFGYYIINTAEYFSPWILVLLSIDRTISMKYHKLAGHMSKKWVKNMLVCLVILIFLCPEIGWIA